MLPSFVRGTSALYRARRANVDTPWWEYDLGRAPVAVIFLDTDAEELADEVSQSMLLLLTASPFAATDLGLSAAQLGAAKLRLSHLAEVLSLRGFAPPEFRSAPDFDGIVPPEVLTRWAMREVILEVLPAPTGVAA